MEKEGKAQELSRYLDTLLRGGESAGVDEEIKALGGLGRSLTEIEFTPRPAHQARIERLLQKHRPILQTGGTRMAHQILGIPLRWFLGLIALLAGLTVTGGAVLVIVVISSGVLEPVLGPATPVLTPGITATLPVTTTMPTIIVTA